MSVAVETKRDMLALQWGSGKWSFELMFSLEPSRWALPIAVEYTSYGGIYRGVDCWNRVATVRLLCGAIHFTFDRAAETQEPSR